jgi:3-hydroxyisobutyrate dehydrogenase-like beta-hydroxyacid dehydrogenase
VIIGIAYPGEMGAAFGAALVGAGHSVLWSSPGRSRATAARAVAAGLEDVDSLEELQGRCDVIVALCPPHAAIDVATAFAGFTGLYVEANAVSPTTTRAIASLVDRCVDGGVIGPPPHAPGSTRLYLSGAEAADVAALFEGTAVDARVISGSVGNASALKIAFAAWTKGTAALVLAVRALARAEGVEEHLVAEWKLSLPELPVRSESAARSALLKGWRWVGEMEEIAATFASASLPEGFHLAAAEIFAQTPHRDAPGAGDLDAVLAALTDPKSLT